MAVIGQLIVDFRASTASFAKDLDKASQLSFNTSKQIERSFSLIGAAITGALTVAVSGVATAVGAAIKNADKMGILAHQAGLSAEQFTALAYAASLSDISAQNLSTALIFLSKNLEKSNQQTNEGKAAHSALATLYRGSIPVFADTNAAFLDIIERLSRLGPGYQQTALASQIFGRQIGAQLIPMLASKKGMAELADEARSLGVVISDEVANKANQFDDTVLKLGDAAKGLATRIAVELLPNLQKIADNLLSGAKNIEEYDQKVQFLANSVRVLATTVLLAAGGLYVVGNAAATAFLYAGARSKEGADAARASWEQTKKAYADITSLITDVWIPAQAKLNQESSIPVKTKPIIYDPTSAEQLKKAMDAVTDGLIKQQIEFQLGKNAVSLYDLAQKGATQTQLQFVASLQQQTKFLLDGRDAFGRIADKDFISRMDTSVELSKELTDVWARGREVWDQTRNSVEKMAEKMFVLDELLKAGAIDQDTYNRASHQFAEELGLVQKQSEATKSIFESFKKSVADGFAAAIVGARSFVDVLKSMLTSLEEAILKELIFKQIADSLSGARGFLGAIGGLFGVFAGGKAGGGSVSAGTPYLVGEKGPELFIPSVGGTIIPNGTAGQQIIYNIDARGADPTVEFRIRRAMQETENRAVARSVVANREVALRNA